MTTRIFIGYVPSRLVRRCIFPYPKTYQCSLYSTKVSKPLRILFCGSDEFSCESLRAVHAEKTVNPQLISSIDVLCRPGKRSGRSMTRIREVPIKAVAEELNLPIYERDTFRGWDLPRSGTEPINLIIAVSFGLFVPPRILKSAEYGGLNVHPSLLPNFRGPAPLQHIIMAGEKTIGVTLQTLDDKSFDHGLILSQTPSPGLPIPDPDHCSYNNLLSFIKPKAAELLIQGLRERVFVPPLLDVGHYESKDLKHAPKIKPEDRRIDWSSMNAITIHRRHLALQRLWCTIFINKTSEKRIIFEDFELVPTPNITPPSNPNNSSPETSGSGTGKCSQRFMLFRTHEGGRKSIPYIVDGEAIIIIVQNEALRVQRITLEGQKPKPASRVLVDSLTYAF
ncbi:formyl transferase [Tricladium varicosporioides]|nr:formyl transferase [Hymenoscyphus varicosporioides]